MLFIVSGRDHPGDIEPRLKWREQHRAHYNALGDDLILAGLSATSEGGWGSGHTGRVTGTHGSELLG
jgi:hypothetical protein